MKSFASVTRLTRFVLALFALAIVCNVAAEIPKLKLVNAYPNLKFKRPLWLEQLPDGRTFLLEQRGKVYLLPKNANGKSTTLFFDIEKRKPYVKDEEGLLGMAFHPQFAKNGKFYAFYSAHKPLRSVVSEFRVSKGDHNKIDITTERKLLTIQRPFWNHDGGCILFGPDGKLYITHGDGGSREDPNDNGQNLGTLRGTILRIDVDGATTTRPYGIPRDNPFVNRKGARGEIWAYGLRNVWRMSFDRETGDLWAADVGQNKWEEVNLITRGGNYGWNIRESFHKFKEDGPAKGDWIDPVIEYAHHAGVEKESKFPGHGYGVSITGGYVYRGKAIPVLRGAYVYGDFVTGLIFAVRQKDGKATEHGTIHQQKGKVYQIASFGEDAEGELYLLPLVSNPPTKRDPLGGILQLVAE